MAKDSGFYCLVYISHPYPTARCRCWCWRQCDAQLLLLFLPSQQQHLSRLHIPASKPPLRSAVAVELASPRSLVKSYPRLGASICWQLCDRRVGYGCRMSCWCLHVFSAPTFFVVGLLAWPPAFGDAEDMSQVCRQQAASRRVCVRGSRCRCNVGRFCGGIAHKMGVPLPN